MPPTKSSALAIRANELARKNGRGLTLRRPPYLTRTGEENADPVHPLPQAGEGWNPDQAPMRGRFSQLSTREK
jgi:hypothetical protein